MFTEYKTAKYCFLSDTTDCDFNILWPSRPTGSQASAYIVPAERSEILWG